MLPLLNIDERTRAGTRVMGFDEPAEATSGAPASSSSRTPSGSSCSYGETASGRQKVTNLRLPGQYDERLFAAAGIGGLPGPYYNWNRWYLPSVGRYMELDPIALAGGFNGFYGPNWYGYAEGNPLRWVDPWGLGPNDWWDPQFYWDYWGNSFGAASDFWRNYWDLRNANHIGADKYFHCLANCEASRRGFGGYETSLFISETREWLDEHVKRDPPSACNDDRAANAWGRDRIRDYERRQSPATPMWEKDAMNCRLVCRSTAPPSLPWTW